ncbi:MAG: RNA polymerase sigma factor [Muribaculaceae bacterium]|nr:RNA polymerase sigma factor [Muribaculaceae bacterium]
MKSPPENEILFNSLIKENSRIINSVCYFYSSEIIPFEDLRQEVYINIWKGIDQFRSESKVSTWIYRIAINTALMAIRTGKKRINTVPIDSMVFNISQESDNSQKDRLEALDSLIEKLDEIEKAIILLWLDEFSYEEIAETMGMKNSNVATKIFRIKEKLVKLK